MRWSARITACLVRAGPIRCSMRGMLCQLMFMPSPISGTRMMGVAGHDAKIQRHRQRNAAADAKALDGADRDLLHLLPGAGQPRPEFQVPAQRPDIHGPARAAFGVLQIEAGAERLGAAGQHHDGGLAVILEAARGIGELAQRFRRQRIDAVAAVEAHHRDAALGAQALLDRDEIRHRMPPCPHFIFPEHAIQSSSPRHSRNIAPIFAAMTDHDHDHHHHDHDHSELSETELRVRALETILTEKGYVDPAALDAIDRDLRDQDRPAQRRPRRRPSLDRSGVHARLLEDATPAIVELGYAGRQGEHIVAVENTPAAPQHGRVHAVLLLSLGGAGAAAGLVQSRALSLHAR